MPPRVSIERDTHAELRVKSTESIPNEPCGFCGQTAGDNSLWFVYDDGTEPRDLILHGPCAELIGKFGEQRVAQIRRDQDAS